MKYSCVLFLVIVRLLPSVESLELVYLDRLLEEVENKIRPVVVIMIEVVVIVRPY